MKREDQLARELPELSYMYVETDLHPREIPKMSKVKAGTMFLVPFVEEYEHGKLPEFSIIVGGQTLPRELYPELSSVFTETGGFYELTLPNLVGKFILGFDEKGEPIKGSAAIFYQTVPPELFPVRDIR